MPLKKRKKNYNATENLVLFLFSLTIDYNNLCKRLQYLKELYRLLKLLLFLLPIFRVLFLITEKNILFFQKKKKNQWVHTRRKNKRYKVVVWKKGDDRKAQREVGFQTAWCPRVIARKTRRNVARELRATGTLYTAKVGRMPVKARKFKGTILERCTASLGELAKFVELPTRPIKVRRTGPRYQRTARIKVSDNRSPEKVLGHRETFGPTLESRPNRPWSHHVPVRTRGNWEKRFFSFFFFLINCALKYSEYFFLMENILLGNLFSGK